MRPAPIHVTLILAAAVAALTGCSRLPTAPSTDAAPAPGGTPTLIGRADDPIPKEVPGDGSIGTVTLTVGHAAALQAGRFTLFIHKNSLKSPATITMVQPDPNVMAVQFIVSPPSANNFQVPLKLVANCSKDTPAVFQSETIFWWNGGWQPASSPAVDSTAQTIMVQTKQLVNAMLGPK